MFQLHFQKQFYFLGMQFHASSHIIVHLKHNIRISSQLQKCMYIFNFQVKYLDISTQFDEVNRNIAKFQDEMNKVAEMSKVKEKQLASIEAKVIVLR